MMDDGTYADMKNQNLVEEDSDRAGYEASCESLGVTPEPSPEQDSGKGDNSTIPMDSPEAENVDSLANAFAEAAARDAEVEGQLVTRDESPRNVYFYAEEDLPKASDNKHAWQRFADDREIGYPDDASKDQIIEAVRAGAVKTDS
jgi:hypothetical protein